MRVWFLADTHFGVKNDNEIWLDDFYKYFIDVAIPTMKKEYREGDILVHLGDVFDNRATVGLNTIYKTLDIFDRLCDIFSDIRIVIGNHDIFNKSSNYVTSVKILERYPGIKLYYEPVVEELCGKKILFNPWVNDGGEEKALLSSVNADYVFGHLEINGCTMNASGIKSSSENGIERNSFKKAEVYAGHIHKKQDLKNVHYVGSPYQMTRGDRDNRTGLSVLDIESGEVEFFENKYSPVFRKVMIEDIMDYTIEDMKKKWNNSFVDLYVSGKDILSCKFDELSDLLNGYYREFSVHQDNTESVIESDVKEVVDDGNKSVEDHVDGWLKDNDISGKQYDDIMKLFNKYKEQL